MCVLSSGLNTPTSTNASSRLPSAGETAACSQALVSSLQDRTQGGREGGRREREGKQTRIKQNISDFVVYENSSLKIILFIFDSAGFSLLHRLFSS